MTAFSVIIRDYIAENAALLQSIADNVSELRGITLTNRLPVQLLDESALLAREENLLERGLDTAAARVDPIVWRAFDFVEPGYVFDRDAVRASDGETADGALYDPQPDAILLREPADTLSALTQWAYVGAYTRGLLNCLPRSP